MAGDHGAVGEPSHDAKSLYAYGSQFGHHNVQVNIYGPGTWSWAHAQPPLGKGRSPYRGLLAFEQEDEQFFFGRDDAVDELMALMSQCAVGSGLLMVSGVSGAGKSSLLRAGFLPRMQSAGLTSVRGSDRWPRLLLPTPGSAPLQELAFQVAVLAGSDAGVAQREVAADPSQFAITARQAAVAKYAGPGSARLVVVIDQFEHLFTQCADEGQRRAYVAALHAAATAQAALVVLGVRADFEARCADYPELASAVQRRFLLTAMADWQLRLAITGPASRRDVRFDDALVSTLVQEVSSRRPASAAGPASSAGVLPLLSYCLDQAWRNHSGATVTLKDYERTGGIEKAVAASAQEAYGRLTPSQREAARKIFLRLTATSADGTDTAVPASRAELVAGADTNEVQAVIDAFDAERLLTLASGTVEISHEVLLTAWPLLRDTWLAETRADRAVRTRLRDAAGEWVASGRNQSYLYRGTVLASAMSAAGRITGDPGRHPPLSPSERDFLKVSARTSKRRARLLRGTVAILAGLVLVLAVVSVAAVRASRQYASERDIAAAGALAVESQALGNSDPVLARLEAVAAWRLDPSSAQARYAMQKAATLQGIAVLNGPQPGAAQAVAFSPDGMTLAVGTGTQPNDSGPAGLGSGALQFWDTVTHTPIGPPHVIPGTGPVLSVAFSRNGKVLAAGTRNGGTQLWDLASHQMIATLSAGPGHEVISVAFSPDGGTLAAGIAPLTTNGGGYTQLWNVDSRRQDSPPIPGDYVSGVAFSPDGKTLASSSSNGDTVLWNVSSRSQEGTIPGTFDATSPVFSPDGMTLAVAYSNGFRTFNVRTRRQAAFIPVTGTDLSRTMTFSPDGSVLAITRDSAAELWDLRTSRRVGEVNSSTGSISCLAFSRDGRTLATGTSVSTELWSVSAALGEPTTTLHARDWVTALRYRPRGATLAVSTDTGARLWNTRTRKPISPPVPIKRILYLGAYAAFSPDGRRVAVVDATGRHLWTLGTDRHSVTLPGTGDGFAVAFSPDGKLLAIGTGSGTQLWDVAAQRRIATLPSRGDFIYSAAFSPDSRLLLTSAGSRMQLWNVVTRQRVGSPIAVGGFVDSAAFSPDGRAVAAATSAGTQLLDVATRQPDGPPLPSGPANRAAWSPDNDGAVLAVATGAGTQLWNTATRQPIGTPLGTSAVWSVTWSPDKRTLATGDENGEVRLWDVARLITAGIPSYLCEQAGQTLPQPPWTHLALGVPYRNVCL